ncbi:putative ribonuclease H [Ralstonia phage RP12]|uniref:ribonuclease H n=1 Tax=Ralstonia phage RP12 TaxID=1923889 RepID=A0A1L7N0Q1_9CAUD|nr:ribonuclease [Ralstonia phage RP12]BAW19036.1 putative ribonuclease H [Ralstonia phage RP12]
MFGYVFYPDGGCHPQNEYSGAGLHGYRWNLGLTAKGIGHNTHSATFRGYISKGDSFEFASKDFKNEVNEMTREAFLEWLDGTTGNAPNFEHRVPIERYYDSYIPLEYGGTNNTAELLGAIHCLERIITEPDFDQTAIIVIRQDSRYVVDGHNTYLANWLNNNFVRRDGTTVKNKELWERADRIGKAIRERGIRVHFEWVEGHGTCIGNNSADDLATAARITSKYPKDVAKLDTSFRISEATDYWASRSDLRHPMMCQRYGYLGIDAAEGERTEYYMSTQGKDSDLDGKRTADDGFSVVRIEPQRYLENVIAKQVSLPREVDYKFKFDLDNIYGAAGRYLDLYGTDFLHRVVDHKRHLQTFGKVLVTTECMPPFLVDRVFDNMDILSDFLDNYKKPDQATLQTTEITSEFFNYEEVAEKVKKGEEPRTKTVCSLKPEIIVGYAKHKTQAQWKESNGEVKSCDITLRLGIDLPDRNALRRLEDKHPKMWLLTNNLGGGSFMYAVVIEAGDDVGIWSGVNSSIRVTAKPSAKAKAK